MILSWVGKHDGPDREGHGRVVIQGGHSGRRVPVLIGITANKFNDTVPLKTFVAVPVAQSPVKTASLVKNANAVKTVSPVKKASPVKTIGPVTTVSPVN